MQLPRTLISVPPSGEGSLDVPPEMSSKHPMRPRVALRMRLALTLSLALLAVGIGVVLSRPPLTLAGTNGIPPNFAVAWIQQRATICQGAGTVPRGTTAIRVSLSANTGPEVRLTVLSGTKVLSAGKRAAGWGVTETVTVPVRPLAHPISKATVCVKTGRPSEPIQVNGKRVRNAEGGEGVRLRTEYMRPGTGSWLSRAGSVARSLGFGRAPSGTWVAFIAVGLMLVVSVLASTELLRSARASVIPSPRAKRLNHLRRIPTAAYMCALIAVLSATCWSLLTPPFQAPDEPSHFAYVQELAQEHRLPNPRAETPQAETFSQEEDSVLTDLRQTAVMWHPEVKATFSAAAGRRLREDLSKPLSRNGPGWAGVASSEPPLYYGLAAIPYLLGSKGTLLDRLELVRLLSALMAGLTALFSFMFVRELLPGAPWAWTVGGLGVSLTPLLGFTSGVVTPDSMLAAVCAAIFLSLARAFRRGLTWRLAVAIGALTAAGFATKVNFVGFAPGVVLGLVILGARSARGAEPRTLEQAWAMPAVALAIAVSPVLAYVAYNLVVGHPALGVVSSFIQLSSGRGSLLDKATYVWDFYLPHLPGMTNYFPGLSTPRQLWFDRTVGLYGWLDTAFPGWVYTAALLPTGLGALLVLRTVGSRRKAVRRRVSELVVYLTAALGILVLIGTDSQLHRSVEGAGYAQARYLLPMIPLLAAALALAARGGGRRWGPVVGTVIVVLFLAHDIFSQLLVVSRFYG